MQQDRASDLAFIGEGDQDSASAPTFPNPAPVPTRVASGTQFLVVPIKFITMKPLIGEKSYD